MKSWVMTRHSFAGPDRLNSICAGKVSFGGERRVFLPKLPGGPG